MLSAKAHDSENLTHKKQSKKHTARLHEQRVVYDPAYLLAIDLEQRPASEFMRWRMR
jgi:hypothetical protein